MSEKPGGYRVGAGRKSQWRSPTKMMRLPAQLESELVTIAHKLDTGEPLDSMGFTFTLDELNSAMVAVLMSIPPRDRKDANRLYKKLLRRLREP
jgi:hypothetical protein